MSSRLNVKASKKERPRSSDKLRKGRRDGTPEKPSTPNEGSAHQTGLEEGTPQPDRKQALINDEILSLAIKEDQLAKLHTSHVGRKSPPTTSVVVRKLKPASEWDKPTPKSVTVARPAPPDAPLQPFDPADAGGVRFDGSGKVVAHSILGSVEEYKRHAALSGDLPKELTMLRDDEMLPAALTPKYEKKTRTGKNSQHPKYESVEESNALRNWQLKMMERKRQQGYLSKLLNKGPETLVMNQADQFRQTQELRYLVDRTIPCMDYGKGYRVGSEFWNQQERIGNDLTGIHMTLAQTEKGYPPPIEHVGVPRTILEEKGSDWSRPNTPFNKPWHKNPYLHQRINQLDPVMKELDPYAPDLAGLSIVGVAGCADTGRSQHQAPTPVQQEPSAEELDPLREHPDVHITPVLGPSILFAGQPARWTGSSSHMAGHIGIEARVTFEAYAGHRGTSYLEINNDGTTAIYYDWKKLPKNNPFDLVNKKVQRFYFNNSNGVVLPGDTVKFPFVFKSPNAGVFTEQWQLQTHPVVCGGAALVVTLRGVALQEDKFKKARTDLEIELSHRQAEQVVAGVLDALLDAIRPPDRPSSPVDAYLTQEQIFLKKNPAGLHYHGEIVVELADMYRRICYPESDQAEPSIQVEGVERVPSYQVPWDLSIHTLKCALLDLDDGDDRKQVFLQKLNGYVQGLSYPAFTPTQKLMYSAGYAILCEGIDSMVEQCMSIRSVLGIPDPEPEEAPEDTSDKGGKAASQKGSKEAVSKDKKATGRDSKQPPKTPASREGPKPGGKITPASKGRPSGSADPQGHQPTSPSGGTSPVPAGVDPVLQAKYQDKIYTQTYQIIHEVVDRMGCAFVQAQEQDGGPRQPRL